MSVLAEPWFVCKSRLIGVLVSAYRVSYMLWECIFWRIQTLLHIELEVHVTVAGFRLLASEGPVRSRGYGEERVYDSELQRHLNPQDGL